jgi:hypothetical protein
VSSLTQSEWIKIFRDVIKQNNGAGLYYSLRKLPDALKNICEEAVDGSNLLEFVSLHHIHISSCIYTFLGNIALVMDRGAPSRQFY